MTTNPPTLHAKENDADTNHAYYMETAIQATMDANNLSSRARNHRFGNYSVYFADEANRPHNNSRSCDRRPENRRDAMEGITAGIESPDHHHSKHTPDRRGLGKGLSLRMTRGSSSAYRA